MSRTETLPSPASASRPPARSPFTPLMAYLRTCACITLVTLLPRALPALGIALRCLGITLTITEVDRGGGRKMMAMVITTTARRDTLEMGGGTREGEELARDSTTKSTTTWIKLDNDGVWEAVRTADALMFTEDGNISIGRYVDESTPSGGKEAEDIMRVATDVSQNGISEEEEGVPVRAGRWGRATTAMAQQCYDNSPETDSKYREYMCPEECGDPEIGKHTAHWDKSVSASEEEGRKGGESSVINYSRLGNIFDERPCTAEDTWVSFKRLARGPQNPTLTAARSGDSIGSDDPFLPPGLSNIALSLTPRRMFSGTSIQPGSPAASSSRSRMSFAKFFREDDELKVAAQPDGVIVPYTSPHEAGTLESAATLKTSSTERRSQFASVSESVHPFLGVNTVIGSTPTSRGQTVGNSTDLVSKPGNSTTRSGMTAGETDVKTPTHLYRALSALSFWTPAPKITVNIVPPVKRRRGGRRREKERPEHEKERELREKEKERVKDCVDYDVFGERRALQPIIQN